MRAHRPRPASRGWADHRTFSSEVNLSEVSWMTAFPPPSALLAILPGVDCECTHLSPRKKRSQPRPRLCGALFLLSLSRVARFHGFQEEGQVGSPRCDVGQDNDWGIAGVLHLGGGRSAAQVGMKDESARSGATRDAERGREVGTGISINMKCFPSAASINKVKLP